MADVKLNISCGCGFKARRLEEAEKHSDTSHHIITVLGMIKPTVSKAANKATSKVSPARPQKLEGIADDSASIIRALRAAFGKK